MPSRAIVVTGECPYELKRTQAWRCQDFSPLGELAGGHVSCMWPAKCQLSGLEVAVRSFTKGQLTQAQQDTLEAAIRQQATVSHPSLLQLYVAFEEEAQVHLLHELASKGNLVAYLAACGNGKMTERQAVQLVIQPCLAALQLLHKAGMAHGQITPSHILFTREGAVRLAGLGLASLSNTASSPAVASKEADCWAIGALAYHACVGKSAEANLSQVPAFPLWLSDHGKAFIASAMDPDPKQRATVDALLATAWIRNHTKAGADHIQGSITPSAAPIKLNVPASEPEPVSAPALPLVSALEPEPVPELKTRRSIPLAVTIPAVEEDIRKVSISPPTPASPTKATRNLTNMKSSRSMKMADGPPKTPSEQVWNPAFTPKRPEVSSSRKFDSFTSFSKSFSKPQN